MANDIGTLLFYNDLLWAGVGGGMAYIVMKSYEYYKGYALLQEIKKGNYVLVKKAEPVVNWAGGGGNSQKRL